MILYIISLSTNNYKKEEYGRYSSGTDGSTFRQLHNTICGIKNQFLFNSNFLPNPNNIRISNLRIPLNQIIKANPMPFGNGR